MRRRSRIYAVVALAAVILGAATAYLVVTISREQRPFLIAHCCGGDLVVTTAVVRSA